MMAAKPRRMVRFRVLPVAIGCLGVLLSVKIGGFWSDMTDQNSGFSLRANQAQAAEETEEASDQTESAAAGTEPEDVETDGAVADQGTAAGSADGFVDLSQMTESEILTLQRLVTRRNELKAWEEDIAMRDRLLKATETRVEQKIAELTQLKGTVEALIDKFDKQEEAKLKSLVTIYEKMKSKDAARIFNDLEMDVLLKVLGRMKESKTAPILADMDPARAKGVTLEMARQREPAEVAERP